MTALKISFFGRPQMGVVSPLPLRSLHNNPGRSVELNEECLVWSIGRFLVTRWRWESGSSLVFFFLCLSLPLVQKRGGGAEGEEEEGDELPFRGKESP